MRNNFRLSTIAVALAAISSGAIAAPINETRTNTDTNLGNNYQQTTGTSEYTTTATGWTDTSRLETANNSTIANSTTKTVTGQVEIGGVDYRNYSYTETRNGVLENTNDSYSTALTGNNQATRTETVISNNTNTGKVNRTANTRIQLNGINSEVAGTEERLNDSSFAFTADDLAAVNNAIKTSYYQKNVSTAYTSADVRDTSYESSTKTSNLTSEFKRDANGAATTELHSLGNVSNSVDVVETNFRTSINGNGKIVSQQVDGKTYEEISTASSETKSTDYATVGGNIVGFELTNGNTDIHESTVVTNKSTQSSVETDYDEVGALSYTEKQTSSNSTVSESILDGFKYVNENSAEQDNKTYNQGNHALNFDNSSKSSSKTVDREFVKNAAGQIVLTNNKPTVASETTTTTATETAEATYQNSIITAAGPNQNQPFNAVILNNGTATTWTDSNIAKSVDNSESSIVKSRTADGFQEHWNTKNVNTANYARNLQENIEVDRELVDSNLTDNRVLSKLTGISITKAGQDADFALGTVAVDVDGNKFTVNDVNTWKDETGKDRYYVVIDQDVDGRDIRSEVTFTNGNPLETAAAEIETVVKTDTLVQRTDKVTMGQEVAYHTTDKKQDNEKVTSLDGQTVYSIDNESRETDTKVYSIGKNALHHEKTTNLTGEILDTEFEELNGTVVFENGKPVVNSVASGKYSANVNERIYQEGQAKTSENSLNYAIETQQTNATGNVVSTLKASGNEANVNYAKGQELASTNVSNNTLAETNKAVTSNIGFNYDGTAKANVGSNDLRNDGAVDGGLAVSAAKEGNIIVDTQSNVTASNDTKVYQDGGAKAYTSVEANTDVTTITYADATTGTVKQNDSSSVTLFNKGKADKYREAVEKTESETIAKAYKFDEDGDVILDANGKPVEVGTTSVKSTETTTENLYQIGQERKTDSVVTTNDSKKINNLDGSASDYTAQNTETAIEYRAGQVDGKAAETRTVESTALKVTNANNTGFTYSTSLNDNTTAYDTDTGLLASQAVLNKSSTERTETLAETGKDTVSITRGTTDENRTDESSTSKVYGSETITAAAGTKTVVSKSQTSVEDKFNTFESETINRTQATVAADGSSTAKSETRVDTVQGITLTEDKVVTDKDGKATTTVVASTTVKAGEIKVGDVTISSDKGLSAGGKVVSNVADGVAVTDAVNVGQLQRSENRLARRLDDVEKTAYRGVAIALAAQQQVPNIQPGQFAVFGGIGHYEGESAGALGVVGSVNERTSISAAFGVAGGGDVGGRVGVAYVFGGN